MTFHKIRKFFRGEISRNRVTMLPGFSLFQPRVPKIELLLRAQIISRSLTKPSSCERECNHQNTVYV